LETLNAACLTYFALKNLGDVTADRPEREDGLDLLG
jgi:hypothetical protein